MKILTWNSRGYKFGEDVRVLVKAIHPEIIALQECGDIRRISPEGWCHINGEHPLFHGTWNCGKEHYNVYYYGWRNFSRCSMATLVRGDIECGKVNCIEALFPQSVRDKYEEESTEEDDTEHKGIRATIRLYVNCGGSELYICNVHLPSGCPGFARKIGYVYLSCSSFNSSSMIMVGDFNTVPASWTLKNGLRIIGSGEPTHVGEKELDYAITNSAMKIRAEVAGHVISDHYPVLFTILEIV